MFFVSYNIALLDAVFLTFLASLSYTSDIAASKKENSLKSLSITSPRIPAIDLRDVGTISFLQRYPTSGFSLRSV